MIESLRTFLLRKRVLVPAAALIAAGFGAWLVFRLRTMEIETSVTLPVAYEGRILDASGWPHVHLTRDGEFFLRSERVTLEELEQRVDDPEQPVLLCADRDASMLHVMYAFHVLRPRGRVWIAVDDGWRRAVLPTTTPAAFGALEVAAHVPDPEDAGAYFFALSGDDEDEPTIVRERGHLIDAIQDRLPDTEDALEETFGITAVVGTLTFETRMPFQAFVTAVDAFHASGIRDAQFGNVAPDAWSHRQHRLPHPDHSVWIDRIALWPPTRVHLPLAPFAPEARRWRDNPVVTIDSQGRLLAWNRELTVDQARGRLRKASNRAFEHEGKLLFDQWPLLRADKDAVWRHVAQVLRLIRELQLRHFSLAVSRAVDCSRSAEETALVAARPSDSAPLPLGFEGKLPLGLPAEQGSGLAIRANGTCDGVAITAFAPKTVATVHLRPEPDVPVKYVVAVIHRLRKAGVETISVE